MMAAYVSCRPPVTSTPGGSKKDQDKEKDQDALGLSAYLVFATPQRIFCEDLMSFTD
jgi:hypothetical protein